MIKYCVLSEDLNFIETLQQNLAEFKSFYCIELTGDFEKATNSILKEDPEVLFLDLDTKNNHPSPFEFVNELLQYIERLPCIVGVSNNKEFAYQSFKSDFSDYILKPLKEFEIRKCIMRLKKKIDNSSDRVCFKSYSDYHFLNYDEVIYLKADNNTTDIYLRDGSKVTAFDNLKSFEIKLSKKFLRIHNSYMVNISYLRRINFGKAKLSLKFSGNIINIPFSKSYRDVVQRLKYEMVPSSLN